MIERIDHVNLVVNDMATMIEFYRDVLGLRLTKQAVIGGQWIDDVTGLPRVEAEVAFLEAPTGPSIELICYRTPAGAWPNRPDAPNAHGFRHMAFRVRNIVQLAASMSAAGIKFMSPIQRVPAAQVDYADLRKSIVYCRDPEGNLLELCAYE